MVFDILHVFLLQLLGLFQKYWKITFFLENELFLHFLLNSLSTNIKCDACPPGGFFWSAMIKPILGLKTRPNMCEINIRHQQSGKNKYF